MTVPVAESRPRRTKVIRTPRLDYLYEKLLDLDDFTAQTNFLKAHGWHLVTLSKDGTTDIPRRRLPDRRVAWLSVETTPDQHFRLVDVDFQP